MSAFINIVTYPPETFGEPVFIRVQICPTPGHSSWRFEVRRRGYMNINKPVF